MAGSHRAPRSSVPPRASSGPSRRKAPATLAPWMLVTAAVVAVIPALWLGGHRLLDSDPQATPTPQVPIPSVSAPGNPTPTPPAPTFTKKPAALPRVAASVPRRLTVRGLMDVGFDDAISPKQGGFTAGSTAEAARWESRGRPGSPGSDTVYLVGKVYRKGDSAFGRLPDLRPGATVSLRTDNGTLTYTVATSASVPATGLLTTPTFTQRVPGRLVLVGILFDARDDQRTGKYLVVVARLSGARRS